MRMLKQLLGTTPHRMALTVVLGMLVCSAVVWKAEMKRSEENGVLAERRKIGAQRLNEALLRDQDHYSIGVLASLAAIQEQIRGGRWSDQCLTDILKAMHDEKVNIVVRVRALSTLTLPLSEGKFTDAQREKTKVAIRLCLEDPQWIIRLKACEMVWRLQDREAIGMLRKLRLDDRPSVRAAAEKVLSGLKEA